MTIENDSHNCALKVRCTQGDFGANNLSNISKVNVYRSSANEPVHLIGEKIVVTTADLDFAFMDFYVLNKTEYTYRCIPVVGSTEGVGVTGTAKCEYNNLFIGNENEFYIGALNIEYNHTTKFNKSYVQTYYAAYPHAIANGDSVYETGDVSGLFLEFDENTCQFDIDGAGAYKRKLKAFLAGKGNKVLKTREGDIWVIQVDGEVKEVYNRSYGASEISFSWTQVGAAPEQGIWLL